MEECEIALFPIPGSVNFPYAKVPLHVFEPRYRTLVKDAIRLKRRIAVCHTKKVISASKHNGSTAEILNSNQATYEPYPIFSAGFAEIKEVTNDGRLITEINMDQRFEFIEDVQTLPYRIARCRVYNDEPALANPEALHEYRQKVDQTLRVLGEDLGEEFSEMVSSRGWTSLSDEEYSYRIFQMIRFEPDVMQMVLALKSPAERLRFLADAMIAPAGNS